MDENANTILITVMIEKEGSRIIEFPVEGIQVNNLKDKYELTFESDEVIELKFIGEQTTLDQLDITNAVSIDLQDCKSTGKYPQDLQGRIPGYHETGRASKEYGTACQTASQIKEGEYS